MASKRIIGMSVISGLLIAALGSTAFAETTGSAVVKANSSDVRSGASAGRKTVESGASEGSTQEADTIRELSDRLTDGTNSLDELGDLLPASQQSEAWALMQKLNSSVAETADSMKKAEAHYQQENYDRVAQVTADGVRLREEPNTDSDIIATVYEGMTFEAAEEAGAASGSEGWYFGSEEYKKQREADAARREEEQEWIRISYFGRTGYIASDYTKVSYEETGSVSYTDRISQEDYDLFAALVYCEAGGEPYAGQLAVASVVLNRVESSRFPSTIRGVIYQKGQFSPAASGSLARALAYGKATGSCYQAVAEALAGHRNGSWLYFHAGTRGNGTVIGHQIFY